MIWRFSKAGDFQGWKAEGFRKAEVAGGRLAGVTDSISVIYSPSLTLDAGKYKTLAFSARCDRYGNGSLYFKREGEVFSEDRKAPFSLIGDGKLHDYTVSLEGNANWRGVIEQVRFDPIYGANAAVEITRVGFVAGPNALANPGGLLDNGDFETPAIPGSRLPQSWRVSAASGGAFKLKRFAEERSVGVLSARRARSSASISQRVAFDLSGVYEIALRYQAQGFRRGDKLTLTLRFDDILGKPLTGGLSFDLSGGKGSWASLKRAFTLPADAAAGQVEVRLYSSAGGAAALVDDISLRRVAEAGQEVSTKPFNWTAEWVWLPEYREDDESPVYFRKTFILPEKGRLNRARVLVTADNVCTLYVNGEQVPPGPNHADWMTPDLYDITDRLIPGKNAVCVEAANHGGPAGLLQEMAVEMKTGMTVLIKSDRSWRCSTKAADGWSEADFDDSGWLRPLSHGRPPIQPWGDRVGYVYLGRPMEGRVQGLNVPDKARAGTMLRYRLVFKWTGKLPARAALFFELAGKGGKPQVLLRQKLSNDTLPRGQVPIWRYLPPGEYELKISITNVRLTLETNHPTARCADNSLVLPLKILDSGGPIKPPTAKYEIRSGAPALIINGQAHTTMNYWVDYPETPGLIGNCRDNGLHIYFLNVGDTPWKEDGTFDFSEVDAKCAAVLAQDPDAYIIFGVALDNQINRGLQAWVDAHPNELVRDSNGSDSFPDYGGRPSKAPSMASKKWLAMAEDLLRGLIRRARATRYGERVIGYHPANGVTFEWQQWASVASPPVFVDYSEPARRAFIDWLRREYADVAALNASWKTALASFDEIAIPSKEDRCRTDVFTFLDPEKSGREIDFRRYYSELVADDIVRLARVVKEETNGKSICGVFYGYVTHVLGPYRYQLVGHSALRKVLESPDIDYMLSPSDYGDRQVGGASGFMSVTDSVKLHGKVWIDQADLRTHHSTQTGKSETLADSKANMIKHFANALVSGCSEQLYDFSLGWTSGDTRLMRLAGKLREIEQRTFGVSRSLEPGQHSIAVIVDEQSTYYTGMASWIHLETVVTQYAALARTGAGFDTYLLDDLQRMPEYKCYLFLNTFRITKEQQEFIDNRLKKDGKTLIFVYAPGITDGDSLRPGRISEITGINMEVLDREIPLRMKIGAIAGITRYLKPGDAYGYANKYGPVAIPKEGEVLGVLETEPDKPGLVMKQNPEWTCVFSVTPSLPAGLLRGIAEYAGVRVTNPTDGDITFVGDRLIAVHTLMGGRRKLRCGAGAKKVEELVTGKSYVVKDGVFEVDLPPRSTCLYLAR
ncbi:MAG: beta-galactosidase [Armatimonadota bacterium]|nr:beta-galactosidase [Armatimonadota bacterium]